MVPGPKARMQARPPRRARRSSICFNGARPEGQDAGLTRRAASNRSGELQWCPARRPGCRECRQEACVPGAMASMVPGPKARMQGRTVATRRAEPRGFNGARPEGQDAGRPIWRMCHHPPLLQWCPARRPGCRIRVPVKASETIVALQWCPARRPGCRDRRGQLDHEAVVPASMVPGPKARMQDEGRAALVALVLGASMVPGPKARMQVVRAFRTWALWGRFNGARPEGQDAGWIRTLDQLIWLVLQWCPARRPGCRA